MPHAPLRSVPVPPVTAHWGTPKDESFGDLTCAVNRLPSRRLRPVSYLTKTPPTPAPLSRVARTPVSAGTAALTLASSLPTRLLTGGTTPHLPAPSTPAPSTPLPGKSSLPIPAVLPTPGDSTPSTTGMAPTGGVAGNVDAWVDLEVTDPGLGELIADDGAADDAPEESFTSHRGNADRRQWKVEVTDRDRMVLQFLARYKYATYAQLGAYLDWTPASMRRRMPRLAAVGALTFKSVGGPCKVWVPTQAGITLSGMDLTVPEASYATGKHSLALVDLGIRFEQGGEQVVTEREIRAADVRGNLTDRMIQARALIHPNATLEELTARVDGPPLFSIPMGSGEKYLHIPDMVLVRPPAPDGSPGSIAIELELTRKTRSLWKQIFAAYAASPNIGLVVYYTHRRKLATALTATIKDMDLDDMIKVKKYVASDHSPVLNEDD